MQSPASRHAPPVRPTRRGRTPGALAGVGALILLASCRAEETEAPATNRPGAAVAMQDSPGAGRTEVHDFGVVRHGDTVHHDFVLDVRNTFGPGWYSPGTQVDCSCARTELRLRRQDGSERPIETFDPSSAPDEGEVLVVRAILETHRREAVDTQETQSRVLVVLQPVDATDATTRRAWPLEFRYRIDSPVRVRPAAALDFGRVAVGRSKTVELVLASDLENRPVQFADPSSDDARIDVEIEPRGDFSVLRATFSPTDGEDPAVRARVDVETDLDPAYHLALVATATVVPELEATPYPKLSLRWDLRTAQPEERDGSQYVLVTDHDPSRTADFVVAALVDDQDRDASADFAVRFEVVPGEPRSRRVHVRWIGRKDREFRGRLVLAKDRTDGPFLSVELVALHDPKP